MPVRYWRTEVRLITFRSATFRQAGENVVLDAVGKIGVLLIVAKIFERQNRDAFLRRRASRRFRERNRRGRFCFIESSVRLMPLGVRSNAQERRRRYRKPERQRDDDKPHGPRGNFEKRKGLSGDLDQQPGQDRVGDRDAINLPALQLGKKFFAFIALLSLLECRGGCAKRLLFWLGVPRHKRLYICLFDAVLATKHSSSSPTKIAPG